MKNEHRNLLSFLGLPVLFLVAVHAAAPAAPGRGLVQSQRIAHRIDVLITQRQPKEALPTPLANPFATVTAQVAVRRTEEPEAIVRDAPGNAQLEKATPQDIATLARFATRLAFGGTVRRGEQLFVFINDIARKEGDYISITIDNSTAELQLVKILPGSIVIRYKDAEQTLKY